MECECHDASLECERSKDDFGGNEMSLASGILFMVWCSIVFFAIGGWAFMTITRQDKSMYSWDDDEDEQGNLL